jgi:uncharacterized protein YoxC
MEREFFVWIMEAIGASMTAVIGVAIYLHKDTNRQIDAINKRTEEISARTDRLFEQVSLRTDALYEMFCDLIKEVKNK